MKNAAASWRLVVHIYAWLWMAVAVVQRLWSGVAVEKSSRKDLYKTITLFKLIFLDKKDVRVRALSYRIKYLAISDGSQKQHSALILSYVAMAVPLENGTISLTDQIGAKNILDHNHTFYLSQRSRSRLF